MDFDSLIRQARKQEIPLLLPHDVPAGRDFQTNPSVDFGQYIRRVPRLVLVPADQHQLRACVLMLAQRKIPFCTRGAGHSSGGQTLIEDGAVVDCRSLNRIVSDADPSTITVEGGAWWRPVAETLMVRGLRPVVLTDNLRTTVAGTLAVGGFGDTSHLHGLQIHHVKRLKLLTPDGESHECDPDSPLFQYTLAGRGQLGIISEATLETLSRPSTLCARIAEWNSVEDFFEDNLRNLESHAYEFLRARLYFLPQEPGRNRVRALAGHFLEKPPSTESPFQRAQLGPYLSVDLFSHPLREPSDQWVHGSPAIEFVLPLPQGLAVWKRLNAGLLACAMARFFPNGSSVMVLRGNPSLPLAPLPDSKHCLLVAVRPVMRLAAIHHYLPVLQHVGREALDAGGKIYAMSIPVDHPRFLQRQYGSALAEFLRLKSEVDPSHLLNPGLFHQGILSS